MAKTATLNIRTDPIIKAQAEKIYQAFGITLTDAVNIFLRKSIMEGGLPFEMREPKPNATLRAADAGNGRYSGRPHASEALHLRARAI